MACEHQPSEPLPPKLVRSAGWEGHLAAGEVTTPCVAKWMIR